MSSKSALAFITVGGYVLLLICVHRFSLVRIRIEQCNVGRPFVESKRLALIIDAIVEIAGPDTPED